MKLSGVRLSVCLSVCLPHHHPFAGGFAAELHVCRRYQSTAGAQQTCTQRQMWAVARCQPTYDAELARVTDWL